MTSKDMRRKSNKEHLGTAANRDAYVARKSVVLSDNSNKAEPDRAPVKKADK